MTNNEFCFWLHGGIELNKSFVIDTDSFDIIKQHLLLVSHSPSDHYMAVNFVNEIKGLMRFTTTCELMLPFWGDVKTKLEQCFNNISQSYLTAREFTSTDFNLPGTAVLYCANIQEKR